MDNKFIFISGLHRSGTSILHEILKVQQNISGFNNTGVPEDEGQHLQSVFPTAKFYGGPGKFALNNDAHLTENSELITDKNKQKLFNEWEKYWDLNSKLLIEKSPPNLIKTRFLQEMFPNSYFITIIRHPIAVSYATKKWSGQSKQALLNHWVKAHEIYFDDVKHINKHIEIKYEDLISNPTNTLEEIGNFLNEKIEYNYQLKEGNSKYFKKWNSFLNNPFEKKTLIKEYEEKLNKFGYSLEDTSFNKKITNL